MNDLKKGDRIRLVHTNDTYTKLEPGDTGTVWGVAEIAGDLYIYVDWDSGSQLSMIPSEGDRCEKV